jgi:hypothetical protein
VGVYLLERQREQNIIAEGNLLHEECTRRIEVPAGAIIDRKVKRRTEAVSGWELRLHALDRAANATRHLGEEVRGMLDESRLPAEGHTIGQRGPALLSTASRRHLDQIQMGHSSLQTTDCYRGTRKQLTGSVIRWDWSWFER